GLRLFLSLATAGWAGYARHVERSIDLIRYLARSLAQRGWVIENEPSLGVLCFLPARQRVGEVRAIVGHVLASGRAWIPVAVLEGREVIRACVTHGGTGRDEINALIDALEAAAAADRAA